LIEFHTTQAGRASRLLINLLIFLLFCPAVVMAQDPTAASFNVDVAFEKKLLNTVTLNVLCSSGEFGESLRQIEAPGRFELNLADFKNGMTSCQIRAELPDGYSVGYSVRSEKLSRADQNGCQFARFGHGDRSYCRIEVTQDPVTLTVYKKWIGPSGEEEDVQLSLECESGQYSGYRYVNEGSPAGWEISEIDPEGILCNVSETVRETFRPDIIDCQGLYIRPGKGEECTMINTKIVKRIEMLNRYGKIIMIVLVLAIGLVAMKRFN
jgi:hypothetical protein